VKKSSTSVKPKGRVDWRSFRAQPLEIEARCRKLTQTHILITVACDP
jgi:hypothetical protein